MRKEQRAGPPKVAVVLAEQEEVVRRCGCETNERRGGGMAGKANAAGVSKEEPGS